MTVTESKGLEKALFFVLHRDKYASAQGHADAHSVKEATREYGPNSVILRDRSLTAEFMDRILSPLALWQLVSCGLSALDGYAKSVMTSVSMRAG